MATVYSANYSTGSNTYTRVKVDYSASSATVTVLYTRTNNYSYATGQASTWVLREGSASGTVIASGNASYVSYTGKVTDFQVWSTTIAHSTSARTLYLSFVSTSTYHYMDFVGTVSIPAQKPNKPTLTATVTSETSIAITYGTSSFNASSGTVSLYGDTTPNFTPDVSNLLETKTTVGNSTFTHSNLTTGDTYYYKVVADNGTQTSTSDELTVLLVFIGMPKIYGSVSGDTKKIEKLYGSVNGDTKKILKVYGSVNGQTKRIF